MDTDMFPKSQYVLIRIVEEGDSFRTPKRGGEGASSSCTDAWEALQYKYHPTPCVWAGGPWVRDRGRQILWSTKNFLVD